jgi:hypothetical protein
MWVPPADLPAPLLFLSIPCAARFYCPPTPSRSARLHRFRNGLVLSNSKPNTIKIGLLCPVPLRLTNQTHLPLHKHIFIFIVLLCVLDSDRHVELLEEMRRMLQGQNEKIESMYKENQELREKVSFLTAVRVLRI